MLLARSDGTGGLMGCSRRAKNHKVMIVKRRLLLNRPGERRRGSDGARTVLRAFNHSAAARVRAAGHAVTAVEAARDAAMLQLRSPAPGQAPGHQRAGLPGRSRLPGEEAEQAAAAIPARIPLGALAPDMVRLDAETKQITHAIWMAAYNAECRGD
jgi:hypothetical protein